jgi:uncharacterized protein (TIGR01244 family)
VAAQPARRYHGRFANPEVEVMRTSAPPFTRVALLAAALVFSAGGLLAQQVTKETVAGVRNFSRVETTVACAGATEASAIPEIKRMGFASIVNLRQAGEAGNDVEAGRAAAKAAGINYVHIPFDSSSPQPAVADRFLEVIRDPANSPAYIHCASANRAAALWMIKRLEVDGWDSDRALKEAEALGLGSAALKQFALDYAAAH